ncbi:MAG: hypothetical protein ACHBN1_32545 [Heteroscytonema crispum UTEX LB 1556]
MGRRVWDDGCGTTGVGDMGEFFQCPMPNAPCPIPHFYFSLLFAN